MKRRKRRMTPREAGIIGALLLAIVWLSYLVIGIYQKEEIARMTVQETRAEVAALEARKQTLAATVEGLETDRGREASLRETYGVAKPGEEVIIVVPKKDIPPPPEQTLWSKIKDFLGI